MNFFRTLADEMLDRLENGPGAYHPEPDVDVTEEEAYEVNRPVELVGRVVQTILDQTQRLVLQRDSAGLDDLATTLDSLVTGLRACQGAVNAARAGKLADAERSMRIANNLFDFAEKYIQRVR